MNGSGASELWDASLVEQTYIRIREGIISGEYPPGFRLRERELSEYLSVSRIPVREALPLLEADGFITTYPRRGAVVRQFTLTDVEELFDLRLSLEVYAARRAAEVVAGGANRPRLQQIMNEAESVTLAGDRDRIALTNTAFHSEIVEMTGNSLLKASMKPIISRLRWLFALTADRDPAIQCSEHLALCKAIYDGKPDLAAALAYAHIELGREPSLTGLSTVLPPS